MQTSSHPHARHGNADLFKEILAAVSRSFYLTLRVLPKEIRGSIGLAYLLARATDTVADQLQSDPSARISTLRGMDDAIQTGAFFALPEAQVQVVAHPFERQLLQRFPELLDHLAESLDRDEIRRLLVTIIGGQILDIERFSTPGQILFLKDRAALDDYTYRVAGCVGEFWTRVCFRHIPRYAKEGEEAMIQKGIRFGKGLQLVNILRDAPEDLANGRCYLPEEELGITGEMLREEPQRAREVLARWNQIARESLASGGEYLRAVRSWRVRLACFLPLAIGMETLDLLKKHPAMEISYRVKVSRANIKKLFILGVLVALIGKVPKRFV